MPVVAVDGHAASENETIIWGVRLLVFEKMEAILLVLPLQRASYSFLSGVGGYRRSYVDDRLSLARAAKEFTL